MIQILGPNCYRNLGQNYPTPKRNACLNSSRECSLGFHQCRRESPQVDRAPGANIGFPTIHLLPEDGSFEDVCQSWRRSCTSCCKKGKTISLNSRICSLPRLRRLFPAVQSALIAISHHMRLSLPSGCAECSTSDLSPHAECSLQSARQMIVSLALAPPP